MEERIDVEALFRETPEGFSLRDVVVRLARPDERVRWDALVEARLNSVTSAWCYQ